jgi:hypothetical protein
MSLATTVPAPIEITRRKLAGLIAATTAAAAALTWAVATVAIDTTAERTRTSAPAIQYATVGIPLSPITAPAGRVVAAAPPIAVGDAYHGVGVTVCPDGAQPINVADSYHGVGATTCP